MSRFEDRLRQIPYPRIENEDGSFSTHRMAAEVDEEGNWYAFPLVQEVDGKLVELEMPDAMSRALSEGNIKKFGKDKASAVEYAQGGYKKGTNIDPSQDLRINGAGASSKVTTIEEMEAAFGKLPDKAGTLEGFTEELLDNPVSRNIGTLPEAFGERTDRISRIIDDPNRSLGNKAAGVVAQTGGYASDLVGGVVGTALDTVVPGTPVRDVVSKLMEIEDVQELVQTYENLPTETKDDLSSIGVVLEAFPLVKAARMFNSTAANSSSQVTDFYSGNPVAKFLGVGQSFGARGVTQATKQALTSQGQALSRNGVPQGAINEIQALSSAASLVAGIKTKLARAEERKQLLKEGKAKPEDFKTDEWVLTGEERQALKRAQDAGKAAEGGGRELASDTTLLSYIEAEIMKSYNILEQSGYKAPILEALSKPLTSYVGSMADTDALRAHIDPNGAMPQGVYDRVMADVLAAHTTANPTAVQKMNPRTNATPEDSIAVVRNAKGQSGIQGEGAGQMGTPYGRLFQGFDDYVTNESRPEVKKLSGTQKAIANLENTIAARGDKGPTPGQQKKLDELKTKEADLSQDLRINGAVASSKHTMGQLFKSFPEGTLDTHSAVDFLRASKLKNGADAAKYAELMARKRRGDVLTKAEQKKHQALLAKEEQYASKGESLARGDRNTLADLNDRIETRTLNPTQEEQLARIQGLMKGADKWTGGTKPNTLRVSGRKDAEGNPDFDDDGYPIPDEDGFLYFVDAHHSSEKALGGVRSTTAFNPTTGETFVTISDGHDIFGLNPMGGKGLVTIVEPTRWNAYDKSKAGTTEKIGASPRGSYGQAVEDLYNMTGVQPSGQNPGQELTGLMTDFAQQYRPTPTAGDKARAGFNQISAGASAGLLSPNIYSSNQEEQQ